MFSQNEDEFVYIGRIFADKELHLLHYCQLGILKNTTKYALALLTEPAKIKKDSNTLRFEKVCCNT